MATVKMGIFGLGRMGRIHLENLCTRIAGAELIAAMNPSEAGRKFAERFNIPLVTDDADQLFNHPDIDALVICSPTDNHADYVTRAARAGKAIFCEKPLDLSLEKVKATLQVVRDANVPLMLAFNQRLDPNFAAVKEQISEGRIGNLQSVHIVSRDPGPPPIGFVKRSGGLFMDMTIHDFDMANFLVAADPVEVYAKGFNLVDPEIGAVGDIDTAAILITFSNNVTVMIENSRKAVYGYDQRLEVFGSGGMIRTENPLKNTNIYTNESGNHAARNADFFMDRYIDSYFHEMNLFVAALRENKPMPISGEDGLKAMLLATAANISVRENRPVLLQEVEAAYRAI